MLGSRYRFVSFGAGTTSLRATAIWDDMVVATVVGCSFSRIPFTVRERVRECVWE